MDDERLRAVARKIVRECAGVAAGEDVYIEGRLDSAAYLELLAFECELVGARPLVVMQSDELNLRRLTDLSEEQLATRAEPWIAAVKAADVVFTVRMEHGDPALFAGVPAAKQGAARKGRKLLADHIYDGTPALDRHRLPHARPGAHARGAVGAFREHLLARSRRRLPAAPRARRPHLRGAREGRDRARAVAQGHGS